MAAAGTFMLKTEIYEEQRRCHWPPTGRHILAHYNEDCIVVYQAFCPEIAEYAVQNGKFGGPKYSFTRMTWIKTNFLWMMYRSNWAQKKNQDRILAIFLSRDGFDQILKFSKGTGIRVEGRTPGNVRIQWDPDHDPKGENQRRRAVQLGIKGIPLQRFHEQYIQQIHDITDFVKQQRQHVLKNELQKLITPVERVYRPSEEQICRHILLDDYHGSKKTSRQNKSVIAEHVPTETVLANDKSRDDDTVGKVNDDCCEPLLHTTNTKPVCKDHKKDLIVCLGGSFNPVHIGHIKLVETAVKWLEENSNYNVVAARLAVAPDSYVEKKCKRKGEVCMKAEHRIKLCELACKGHKLIKTHYTTTLSAHNCGENVRKWENWRDAKVAVVISADKTVFSNNHGTWHTKSKYLTVCVGRKDSTDILRKAYLENYKEDINSNPNFYMIEDELENVNSTEIRQQLCELDDMKSAKNSPRNMGLSDIVNTPHVIEPTNKIADNIMNTENLPVPPRWDEIIHEEMRPLERGDTENNTNALKAQAKLGNCENILLKLDELETEETVPSSWDELILDQDKDNENSSVSRKLDLKNAENGARLKTATYTLGTKSNETVGTSNKGTDLKINLLNRERLVKYFVSKGWLAEPVGEYILDKFSDLYL